MKVGELVVTRWFVWHIILFLLTMVIHKCAYRIILVRRGIYLRVGERCGIFWDMCDHCESDISTELIFTFSVGMICLCRIKKPKFVLKYILRNGRMMLEFDWVSSTKFALWYLGIIVMHRTWIHEMERSTLIDTGVTLRRQLENKQTVIGLCPIFGCPFLVWSCTDKVGTFRISFDGV